MNRIIRLLLVAALCLGSLFVGVAWADEANKRNDIVFNDRPSGRGPDYVEVFKKEGKGDKNYMYTITYVITPSGLYCTVFSYASETQGWGHCQTSEQVTGDKSIFRELRPDAFPDRKYG